MTIEGCGNEGNEEIEQITGGIITEEFETAINRILYAETKGSLNMQDATISNAFNILNRTAQENPSAVQDTRYKRAMRAINSALSGNRARFQGVFI